MYEVEGGNSVCNNNQGDIKEGSKGLNHHVTEIYLTSHHIPFLPNVKYFPFGHVA